MKTRDPFRTLVAVAVVAFGAACSDTTGLGEPVDIDFRMQRIDDGMMTQVTSTLAFHLAGDAEAISPDDVASLTVTVDSIQVLPTGDDEDDGGAWITIVLDEAVVLDLKALPTSGASPIVIASGTVNAGTYANARLFISDATIEFSTDITLGLAANFVAGESYDVTVPSADQTGIKTDAGFEATADADVDLLFDEGATFSNVNATGTGSVMLAPVIRSADDES